MYSDSNNQQPWEQRLESLSPIVGARSCKLANLDDATDLTHGVCRAIYAPTAGNINVVLADDDPATGATVFAFAAGEIKALQARRIYNSDTTVIGPKVLY